MTLCVCLSVVEITGFETKAWNPSFELIHLGPDRFRDSSFRRRYNWKIQALEHSPLAWYGIPHGWQGWTVSAPPSRRAMTLELCHLYSSLRSFPYWSAVGRWPIADVDQFQPVRKTTMNWYRFQEAMWLIAATCGAVKIIFPVWKINVNFLDGTLG